MQPRTQPVRSRAAVFTGGGAINVIEREPPQPGPREVRIRLQGCGLCASNLPVWEGRPWFEYPMPPGAPGHEGWGVIDAVGREVQTLAPGQRVAALSYHAYADYDLAAAGDVIPLPTALDGQPLPGEPLACALNVFRRATIEPDQTVAVVGIGFMGALLVQLCASAGARVIALSRRDFALEIAERCGAAQSIDLDDRDRAIGRIMHQTGQQGCERVIEATGAQAGLDIAGALTQTRGRLIVAGFHQDGPRQVDMQQWNWKGIDVINAHERDPQVYIQGMREAVQALMQGRLDPAPLYTHRLGLDELPRAFELLRDRPDGFLKALIEL